MNERDEDYAVGDEVRSRQKTVGYSYSEPEFGRITKITAAGTITVVVTGGQTHTHRPHRYGWKYQYLQKVTDADRALLAWTTAEPKCVRVRQYRGFSRSTDVTGFKLNEEALKSPEECRAAAAELLAVAEWWAAKPGEE